MYLTGHEAAEVVMGIDLWEYGCIVVVGGDGTVNEVFAALLSHPQVYLYVCM